MSLITAKQYAQHWSVSPAAVSKWIKQGKLGPEGEAWQKSGRIYLVDTERADLLLNLNRKVTLQGTLPVTSEKAGTDEKGEGSYSKARTVETQYRAALTKLEYEIKTGVYVLSEDVRTAAFNRSRAVRDALLNVPDRIAPIVAAESDPVKVNAILTRELKQALEELTRGKGSEPWSRTGGRGE